LFNNSTTHVSHSFELIHSDVWGPFDTSLDGYKYFVTFIDDFSRVTWVYLLKAKSDVFSCFQDFHTLLKNQFSGHLKTFRSNNGSEYMSKDMEHYLHSNGILHQTSYVGTPQQNGVSKRKNRDLLEKTRAIMLQMHVPKGFWSYGVLTAIYLINRLPSRVLDFKSPLEVLQVTSPKLAHLKVFGCSCFVYLPSTKRDKLDSRAVKYIFLGYSQTQKGYRFYDPLQKKMYVSRDVRFSKDTLYYPATGQEEDDFNLFSLPSSSYYD
jgi:transposase InsO family protein